MSPSRLDSVSLMAVVSRLHSCPGRRGLSRLLCSGLQAVRHHQVTAASSPRRAAHVSVVYAAK
ncbi:uncharacterized protein LOC127751856 isoform X2 [Frankliniella occidentalis]|uniref:Uncharacterized protein LOC127751856 isoform X2 n=1 Tax=Frankliniella occidentalis TaxID=133901 RepID=A0A9C6XA88_FRAOC|nr:uncharacterized protein LOC127751856 isoform X2 [Frankliniella occidentalis]